ncbi:MAG: hypothetical protein R3A51_01285 [Nannocystaceae bacterium]
MHFEDAFETPDGVGPVARARVTDGGDLAFLRAHSPANERPAPEPGFYELDEQVFYSTARGQVYRVRTAAIAAMLEPVADLPEQAEFVDEDDYDRQLCILAEAADALEAESIEPGFYTRGEYLYYVSEDCTHLLYLVEGEAEHRVMPLAELPPGAAPIACAAWLPREAFAAAARIDEQVDLSPQAQR